MGVLRAKWWYVATAVFLCLHLPVSFFLKPGYELSAFGDISQFLLTGIAVVTVGQRVFSSQGREKAFWALMTLGAVLWFVPQFWWVWYEVYLKVPAPDPSPGDVFLFLHVVPLMGALVLRPHKRQDEHRLRVDTLDFVLLLMWWVFMYVFVVMPWQFIEFQRFSRYFNFLYFIESFVLVIGAAVLWMISWGGWKRVYGNIFAASLLYAFSSLLVNELIAASKYYTGSLYDVPLAASMCFFVAVGLERTPSPTGDLEPVIASHSAWPARLSTLALISMPVVALWAVRFSHAPHEVNDFRLKTALGAMLMMTLLVFSKQHLLTLELRRLLLKSQQSLANLKRLQDHLINSEKLAALGQLAAGAAHEINNPLTAILGYSDLLTSDSSLTGEPRLVADKIEQQARRTKRLVGNMLSFARQMPAEKTVVHLNALLNNALQLLESDLGGKKIKIATLLDPNLPLVLGDSNHLLQVLLHLMHNAVDAIQEDGGGTLTMSSWTQEGWALVEVADTGPGVKDPQRIFDPFYTTKPTGKRTGLGLTACYVIVRDHGGEISCQNRIEGGAAFLIKLPEYQITQEAPTVPANGSKAES